MKRSISGLSTSLHSSCLSMKTAVLSWIFAPDLGKTWTHFPVKIMENFKKERTNETAKIKNTCLTFYVLNSLF